MKKGVRGLLEVCKNGEDRQRGVFAQALSGMGGCTVIQPKRFEVIEI